MKNNKGSWPDESDKTLARILLHKKSWPDILNDQQVEAFTHMATYLARQRSFAGYYSAAMILHAISEQMLLSLIELSHLYMKGQIYPARLNDDFLKPIRGGEQQYGQIIKELERTMEFKNKSDVISCAYKIKSKRDDLAHRLFAVNNVPKMADAYTYINENFEKLSYAYFKGSDDIIWWLDDLLKPLKSMFEEILSNETK